MGMVFGMERAVFKQAMKARGHRVRAIARGPRACPWLPVLQLAAVRDRLYRAGIIVARLRGDGAADQPPEGPGCLLGEAARRGRWPRVRQLCRPTGVPRLDRDCSAGPRREAQGQVKLAGDLNNESRLWIGDVLCSASALSRDGARNSARVDSTVCGGARGRTLPGAAAGGRSKYVPYKYVPQSGQSRSPTRRRRHRVKPEGFAAGFGFAAKVRTDEP
jgi:hypothetical protein